MTSLPTNCDYRGIMDIFEKVIALVSYGFLSLFSLLYFIYSTLLFRQTQLLSRIVRTPSTWFVVLLVALNLIFALGVVIMAIFAIVEIIHV